MHFSTLTLAASLAIVQVAALPQSGRGPKQWYTTREENFSNMNGWECDLGHGYPGGANAWGTGQIELDTCDQENVFVDGNTLSIRPQRKADGSWTSARIHSKWSAQCRDGERVQVLADIQLPDSPAENQQGIWAAFWTMGTPFFSNVTSWPAHGEFDILEIINGKDLTDSTAGLHCGIAPGGPCDEPSGLTRKHARATNAKRGQFNTYAMTIDRTTGNWRTETITFQVNGITTVVVRGDELMQRSRSEAEARKAWQDSVYVPFTLLVDVAVGGDYPKAPNENTAWSAWAGIDVKNLKIRNWR